MTARNKPLVWVLMGVALVAVAMASGWAWWQSTRNTNLPNQAVVGTAQAFAFVDCKARLFDGSPAIALSFTQPLSRGQDWAKLLIASEGDKPEAAKVVEARWVLGDNPRMLYLPYVTPERTYRITLSETLAAVGGPKLGAAAKCEVKSEAMPASFYFASRGVVLPAGQNGGLPVVTVNTPEVDVQFLRIEAAALPAFLEQVGGRRERRATTTNGEEEESYDGGYNDPARKLKGTVGGYQLDQLRELSTSVYMGRFVTDERKNRRNVNFLPVEKIKELQEPGIYVAVMNPPGRFGWDYQVTYFYVTDIGLHVRRHANQTDVFSTSLKSGEALRGIDLTAIDVGGKSLAQISTNAEGHAVFAGSMDKARAVVARRGKEMSVIALRDPALDLSEFDVDGHPSRNQKLFVYAGRDLYRPGEQFTVSLLARDADGKPLPAPAAGPLPLTLVVKRPDGERVATQTVPRAAVGTAYYQHTVTLPGNAPTGRWLLEARVDPATKRADTAWSFQVEEFLPERMKLDLKAPDGLLKKSAAMEVAVEGNYLYGAPANGNRLLGSVATERLRMALPQAWPGFLFGDFDDDAAKKRQELPEAALDETGKAQVTVLVDTAERKSPMLVRASFSLLESGGRPVVRSIERAWWPAAALVGIRPLFDRDVAQEGGLAEFELTRVTADGKFAPTKEVQIKLVREDRRWYWRYDDNRGWTSGYNLEEEIAEARSLNLSARTKLAVPVGWGRYRVEVLDVDTRQTARYRFYAGWGAQDADDVGNRPDRVAMKLEGAPFKSGDMARLTLTPPHDGEALVTVEGDKVLYQKRVKVRTSGTSIDIPIDATWRRHDLYIAAVAFRPGSQGDRVTPARALGLVHLPLAREERKLKLAITAPLKTTPDQSVPVKVRLTDAAGKPVAGGAAIVTLSAVDVGILNITRYPTPLPQEYFFGKHRYDADILDLYGKLIEKMEGTVAKQRFGGDAGKRDTQSLPRKVRLVDVFSGPVQLDGKGEATITLKLPDFNGTLRLMAVASSADSYASGEAEMVVAAPIVAELSMPRFISPGDSATIALDVTNLSGVSQDVNVQIEAASPLRIIGKTSGVRLADKQRKILSFTAEATDAYGLAAIKMTVTAGNIKIVREAALQVQPVTPSVREVRRVRIEPGATFKFDTAGAEAFWPGSVGVNLSLSNKPPIDVRSAVQGLLMYPYGCLEQTTSSAYPLVFIDEAGARAYGLMPVSREERARRLESAVARLSGMQQQNGGFGLWNGSSPYEAWLSAYVTGFLQDARDAGFAVPGEMHKRASDALLEQLQRAPGLQTKPPKVLRRDAQGNLADFREIEVVRMAHQRFAEAAHAGYILAREQKAPLATLRSLHDDHRGNARSSLALVHLGLALKLMGDEARGRVAFDDALELAWGINPTGNANNWNEWLGDYGSRLRDHALAYALLHRHQINHAKRENLMLDLAGEFDKRAYYSTQERLALFLAARAAGGDSAQPWTATLQAANGAEKISSSAAQQRNFAGDSLRRGMSLVNTSSASLFAELAVEGYPQKPLPARDDRISIERTWWSSNGSALSTRQFKAGDTVLVRLRVSAKQRIKDALVVERIAAGMEVENLNLSQGSRPADFSVEGLNLATAQADARIKYSEYRDDRFVAAVDLNGQKIDLFYLLRVVTPGKYVVPAPFVEDMYRPEIRGVGKPEADIVVLDLRGK